MTTSYFSRTRSRTIKFECDLPDKFGCCYEGITVRANISPGIPETRFSPAEPPWVEDMWIEDENGLDISDYLARNLPAWMWLENRCMEIGE